MVILDQEKLSQMVEQVVFAALRENQEFLTNGLARNLDFGAKWENTLSQAVMNAVTVSTRLSVQIVMSLLIETGLFTVSEKSDYPKLTVIRGGASSDRGSTSQPPQQ